MSGSLLAEIASTGDLRKAQALSGLGTAGVREVQSLYNERAAASQAVGNYAGTAVYGASIASLEKTVKQMAATQKSMAAEQKRRGQGDKKRAQETGKAVAKGVNRGAAAGKKGRR